MLGKPGSHRYSSDSPVDRDSLGLALGVSDHWRLRFRVAGILAAPIAGPSSTPVFPKRKWIIRSDPNPRWPRSPGLDSFPIARLGHLSSGKFMTDPIWWFYLFLDTDFLQRKHGAAHLMNIRLPIVVVSVAYRRHRKRRWSWSVLADPSRAEREPRA